MPARKKTAKKTTAKKATTKKATAKKATTKKVTAKKATAQKAAKKATAKKATAKKAAKKTTAKKATAKKATAKKAAKKATAKKATAKKATAKKATAQKAAKKPGVVVKGTRHEPPVFLLVHLPVELSPFDRAERFEDPLEQALGVHGAVTGAGTQLADDGGPGSCTIEVEVSDVVRALPIIRRVLVDQGAPDGSAVARLSRDGDFEVLFAIGA
jgi:hypothetical protein